MKKGSGIFFWEFLSLVFQNDLKLLQGPIVETLKESTSPAVVSNTQLWIYRMLLYCSAENEVLTFVKAVASFVVEVPGIKPFLLLYLL